MAPTTSLDEMGRRKLTPPEIDGATKKCVDRTDSNGHPPKRLRGKRTVSLSSDSAGHLLRCVPIAVVLAVGCGSEYRAGFAQSPARQAPNVVTRDDYEPNWPFTISKGTVECQHESRRSARVFVTLDTGSGIAYGLNGSAKDFGFPDSKAIMKPDATGADLQPFIKMGLAMCEKQ